MSDSYRFLSMTLCSQPDHGVRLRASQAVQPNVAYCQNAPAGIPVPIGVNFSEKAACEGKDATKFSLWGDTPVLS